jgi:pimeloyl-ACP methyl ester carboxylesterase
MFDRGDGPVLVVVQGLHGRWEWMKPALVHLARSCRTISYSLCGDIGSGQRLKPELGFDNYLRQLDDILDRFGVGQVALCGISFGGFVAVRYAATRPERVRSLVLASAPGPGWKPNPQQARWLATPWLSAPAFVLTTPMRVWPEVQAAFPSWPSRLGFFLRQGLRTVAAPMIPSLMTGEEPLDRVVPVSSTLSFCSLIHGAESGVLVHTGHLGAMTQPSRFADVVGRFVHAHSH